MTNHIHKLAMRNIRYWYLILVLESTIVLWSWYVQMFTVYSQGCVSLGRP